jgi:hypothetical protein
MGESLTEDDVERIVDERVGVLIDAFIAALRRRAEEASTDDDAE